MTTPKALERVRPQLTWAVPTLLPVLICLIPLLAPTPQHLTWAVDGLLWGLWILSLNIVWGFAGQLSFAQLGLGAFGAYSFTLIAVREGINPVLAILASVALTAAASLVLSLAALRLRDFHFAILTVTFALVILTVAASWDVAGRSAGLLLTRSTLPDINVFGLHWVLGSRTGGFFALVAAVFIVANALTVYLAHSGAGAAMRSVRDDEQLSRSLGMNPLSVKTLAFVLSAVVASLAGLLQSLSYELVVPELFALNQALIAVMLLVLVGLGSTYAPLMGAVAYAVLYDIAPINGAYRGGILGAIVVVIIVFSPSGIAGLIRDGWAFLFRRGRRDGSGGSPLGSADLPNSSAPSADLTNPVGQLTSRLTKGT